VCVQGEGFTLGGVWVVHPAKGVIFEYREKHWGDSVLESGLPDLMQGKSLRMGGLRV
jgi:hypothetical protein